MDLSNLLLRPGTILMMIFIAAFGFGVFGWASDAVSSSNREALEEQRSAIDCSSLNIDVVDISRENGVEIFFQTNRDIEDIAVKLEGDRNATETIDSMDAGQLESVSANITGFRRAKFRVGSCTQAFEQ